MEHTLLFTPTDIQALASQILEMDPDPVPRFLLMRELLPCSPDDLSFQAARQAAGRSKWVTELAEAQLPDGSWGNFHSMAAYQKHRFPSSEYAIHRCLALGLDQHSPILQRAAAYIADHLRGQVQWSDRVEKHDHHGLWPAQIRTISAATLARIDHEHPQVDPVRAYWAGIVSTAFASGQYDRSAELAMHQALTGVPSKRFYPFHVLYPLVLLSSGPRILPPDLEERLLTTVLHWPSGIYYVHDRPLDRFPGIGEPQFGNWLCAIELLSRFERWTAVGLNSVNWIWQQRNAQGLWDPGHSTHRSVTLPTSESWRKPGNRVIDWSVWVLRLLNTWFDAW